MSSAKWHIFRLGLFVLKQAPDPVSHCIYPEALSGLYYGIRYNEYFIIANVAYTMTVTFLECIDLIFSQICSVTMRTTETDHSSYLIL